MCFKKAVSLSVNIGVFSSWGESAGSGHFIRDFRLISYFKLLDKTQFFNNYNKKALIDEVESHFINWLDISTFSEAIKPFSHIIIDSYKACDWHYKMAIKDSKKLLIFDDLFLDYPLEAFVLNGAFGAESRIHNSINCSTNRFFGAQYNLTPQIFKQNRKINKDIKNVLICFGASDSANYTSFVLESMAFSSLKPCALESLIDSKTLQNAHFHIVLGAFNANQINKNVLCNIKHTIYQNLDSTNLANLMARSDLAISAAGQTLYEIALSGLPSLVFITAENQKFQASILSDLNGVKITDKQNFISDFGALSFDKRVQMSEALWRLSIGTKISEIARFFRES